MSERDDTTPGIGHNGGPAFPTTAYDHGVDSPGMTLRDWFAGQAVIGIMACHANEGFSLQPENCARWAFDVADAMLKARAS